MTIICTIFFGLVVIVFSFFDFKNGKLVGRIVRYWARSIFVASRIKTKITGLENLDISKNYIFAANHASSLDIPLILGYLPFWTVPIAKIELKWIPFLGFVARSPLRRRVRVAHRPHGALRRIDVGLRHLASVDLTLERLQPVDEGLDTKVHSLELFPTHILGAPCLPVQLDRIVKPRPQVDHALAH